MKDFYSEAPRRLILLNNAETPGLIVLIYRRRWDIEKFYDEFKNKFHRHPIGLRDSASGGANKA